MRKPVGRSACRTQRNSNEDAQKSGAKLSGTYLGRYTGMSELFGEVRNKQTGTVEMPSYNYTRNLTKEAIRSANEAMQAEGPGEGAVQG